jgi:quercetin dioxygenase-like cupin family protein
MINISTQIKNLISYSEGSILSNVIAKPGQGDITLFCMFQGTEITEHTASKDAFVYVIEGKGSFTLNNKKIVMEPGVVITFSKDSKHSLMATENMCFLLFLIYDPKQEKTGKLLG